MNWPIFFLAFISLHSYADVECVPVDHSDLNNIKKALEWHGGAEEIMDQAPCKNPGLPSAKVLSSFIKNKSTGSANGSVHGVSFTNESPALIQAFKDFTTAKDGFGFQNEPKNQLNIQRVYGINPSCTKVICAMEKIWGKDLAQNMLYIKLKHNYNTSELAFNNSSRFTKEELDNVLIALEDIPKHLVPVGEKNQRLTHFKRGYTLAINSPYVVANATIMIFDIYDSQSPIKKQYTIFHEVSHNISDRLKNMDESPAWLRLSGWVKKGDTWSHGKNACMFTKYGTENPWEDYAESLSNYRYNGKKLKETCPQKYNFIRDQVFRGVEYTEVAKCSPIDPQKIKLAQEDMSSRLLSTLDKNKITPEDVKKSCVGDFKSYPINESDLLNCTAKSIGKMGKSSAKGLLAEALLKAGIEDTEYNRSLVLAEFQDVVEKNPDIKLEVSKRIPEVKNAVSAVIEESFATANKFSKELTVGDYSWSTRDCTKLVLASPREEVLECRTKTIIENDRPKQTWNFGLFPKYVPPTIFSETVQNSLGKEREEKLIKMLSTHESVLAGEASIENRFRKDMATHYQQMNYDITTTDGWKKLKPEEFCRIGYAKNDYISAQYAPDGMEIIPALYNKCVEAQSKKRKRFLITEKDWSEMIESFGNQ